MHTNESVHCASSYSRYLRDIIIRMLYETFTTYRGNFLVCTYIQTILLNIIVTCKNSLAHSEDLDLY